MIEAFSALAPLHLYLRKKVIWRASFSHEIFLYNSQIPSLLENISNSVLFDDFFTNKWFVLSKPVNLWRNHKEVIKKMNFVNGLKALTVKCKIDILS